MILTETVAVEMALVGVQEEDVVGQVIEGVVVVGAHQEEGQGDDAPLWVSLIICLLKHLRSKCSYVICVFVFLFSVNNANL